MSRARFLMRQHMARYAIYYLIAVFVYCAGFAAGASLGGRLPLPLPGKVGWSFSLPLLAFTLTGMALCSFSVLAVPAALAITGFRALLCGALAGLTETGFVIIIIGVIPYQIILAPVIIGACVCSMEQAVSLARMPGGKLPLPELNRLRALTVRRTVGLALTAAPSLLWELAVLPSLFMSFSK